MIVLGSARTMMETDWGVNSKTPLYYAFRIDRRLWVWSQTVNSQSPSSDDNQPIQPLSPANPPLVTGNRSAMSASDEDEKTLQILVVEDCDHQNELIQFGLDAPGRERIQTTIAHSIEEAQALIAVNTYGCILLDHTLMDGSGLELLELAENELLTTPVIGLSAGISPETIVEYFKHGCADVLDKADVLVDNGLRRKIADIMAQYHRRIIAAILERERLGSAIVDSQEGLINLARMDRLTGICNRAVFDDFLPEFHKEVANRNRSISDDDCEADDLPGYGCCMIDVDRFKQYNDCYGHGKGDEALRTIAQTIAGGLREYDFVARYGGEEFVLLFDLVTQRTIEVAANRIRRSIEELAIEHTSNIPSEVITISMGACFCDDPSAVSSESVLNRADELLYQAKNAGRNRVAVGSVEGEIHQTAA